MDDSVNPYSPPAASLESAEQLGTVVREGRSVRLDREGRLPERCIVCNEPGTGRRVTRMLYWSPPWWRLTLGIVPVAFIGLGGLMPEAYWLGIGFWGVVALLALIHPFMRTRAEIDVAVCAPHHRLHRITLSISLLLLATVVGLLAVLVGTASGPLGGILVIAVAAMLVFESGRRLFGPLKVRAAKIDRRRVWLRGAGSRFLEALPEADSVRGP